MEFIRKPVLTFEEIPDPLNPELKIAGRGVWENVVIKSTEDLSLFDAPFNVTVGDIKLKGVIPLVKAYDMFTCSIDQAVLLA